MNNQGRNQQRQQKQQSQQYNKNNHQNQHDQVNSGQNKHNHNQANNRNNQFNNASRNQSTHWRQYGASGAAGTSDTAANGRPSNFQRFNMGGNQNGHWGQFNNQSKPSNQVHAPNRTGMRGNDIKPDVTQDLRAAVVKNQKCIKQNDKKNVQANNDKPKTPIVIKSRKTETIANANTNANKNPVIHVGTTDFPTNWSINSYKYGHEDESHWALRKAFMERHKMSFPEDKLVCLAQTFLNIELMGCQYPADTMTQIAELSKGIIEEYRASRSNFLKRSFIGASDAAEKRAKGRTNT